MPLTPLDFVLKEFEQLEDMSQADWLRKMQEFAAFQNAQVDLEPILDRLKSQDKSVTDALNSAVSALYFSDNSDYKNTLFSVVSFLSHIPIEDLDDKTIKAIFILLNPICSHL